MIEAMAQTAGGLVSNHLGLAGSDQVVYFMTIDKARFRRPVGPGDHDLLPGSASPETLERMEIPR